MAGNVTLTPGQLSGLKALCRPLPVAPDMNISGLFQTGNRLFIRLHHQDKAAADLVSLEILGQDRISDPVPYFEITQRPQAQMTSYLLGKGLSNLAGIEEIGGRVYSLFCGSLSPDRLPQADPVRSALALWVHDCLTADIDHQSGLNRYVLPNGAGVSYDLGHAFYSPYFPPFYTFGLDIGDEEIARNAPFVLEVLSRYVRRITGGEDRMIHRLEREYPTTLNKDLSRYYLRYARAGLCRHLYLGRFFQKLRHTRYIPAAVEEICVHTGLPHGIRDWAGLLDALSGQRQQGLDLRHLDLSHADLKRANLRWADLEGADLTGTNLEKADLRHANLAGAIMENTCMTGAIT